MFSGRYRLTGSRLRALALRVCLIAALVLSARQMAAHTHAAPSLESHGCVVCATVADAAAIAADDAPRLELDKPAPPPASREERPLHAPARRAAADRGPPASS